MSNDPVQDLIDQLKLMRVELGDVKKRQLTEERLKYLQAALEDNAKQIAGVQQAAAHGGQQGAERLRCSSSVTGHALARQVRFSGRARSIKLIRNIYLRQFKAGQGTPLFTINDAVFVGVAGRHLSWPR